MTAIAELLLLTKDRNELYDPSLPSKASMLTVVDMNAPGLVECKYCNPFLRSMNMVTINIGAIFSENSTT